LLQLSLPQEIEACSRFRKKIDSTMKRARAVSFVVSFHDQQYSSATAHKHL
jgi:hypothetical protein